MPTFPTAGGCACEAIRFELATPPLFTHACHCLDCRRRSGSAFGLTTFVMRDDFHIIQGDPEAHPSSVRTTRFHCAICQTYIYSASTEFPRTLTIRGGTFDDADVVEPGAHIWVKRKHAWVELPRHIPQFTEEYSLAEVWPNAAVARMESG